MTGLILALMLGCGDKPPPAASGDATSAAEQAWARSLPFALKASFAVSVDAPRAGTKGTTRGALLVHRPGRFRMEIFSPMGTPLVSAASDGDAFGMYLGAQNTWIGTPVAEQALRELTGGAAGLEDLISVLTGRLPFQGATVSDASRTETGWAYTFDGPDNTKALVELDGQELLNQSIVAIDDAGETALTAVYSDYMRAEGNRLPEKLELEVPGLELTLEIKYSSWQELGVIPDSFSIPAPPGARQVDLLELARKARFAKQQGLAPQTLDEILAVEIPE